jgi:ribulose-bisphosphate carboxylase large chain
MVDTMFTAAPPGTHVHPEPTGQRVALLPPSAAAGATDSAVDHSESGRWGSRLKRQRGTFAVEYRVECAASSIEREALDLAAEQTVELPRDLVPDAVAKTVIGHIVSIDPAGATAFRVRILYPVATTGGEFTQFLNVVFGNTSLQPNVRVEDVDVDPAMLEVAGPRFGVSGVRRLLHTESRPLLATALKPMGLGVEELASLAYRFARGGIDIIKDDHGLTDQSMAPFGQRVKRCADAVQRANHETHGHSLYIANVSADFDGIMARAALARDAGAGGLMAAPGLIGFSAFRALAARHDLGLPMVSHPAFLGGWLTSPRTGIAHRVLLGTLQRLAGADMVIFPHVSGRFSFSLADCKDLARGLVEPREGLGSALPVPAGGMILSRVSEIVGTYGPDVVLLIGGDLFRQGPDLEGTARRFRRIVDECFHQTSSDCLASLDTPSAPRATVGSIDT